LRVETGIDGIEDSLAVIAGIHCFTVLLRRHRESRRARIKPYFSGALQPFLITFRIAAAPIE
jgi:hypothetical protein